MNLNLTIEVTFYPYNFYKAEPLLELIKHSKGYIVTYNNGGRVNQYTSVEQYGITMDLAFKEESHLGQFVIQFFNYQLNHESDYVYARISYENEANEAVSDPHRQNEVTKKMRREIVDSINEIYTIYSEMGRLEKKK